MKTRLISLLKSPVSITITNNTRSIISVKRKDKAYLVRLHHMFLDADDNVLKALAEFIMGNTEDTGKILRSYIKGNEGKIRKKNSTPTPRQISIKTQGSYFNLLNAFNRLNHSYFQDKVDCRITWGYRRPSSGQKSVRLGSYSHKSSMIRINPLLDRSFVPGYVIDNIIHHEMLHNFTGFIDINGRNLSHHKTFREMEKKFIHGEKARSWIKNKMKRLL